MASGIYVLKNTTPYEREEVSGSEWSGAPCRVLTMQDAG